MRRGGVPISLPQLRGGFHERKDLLDELFPLKPRPQPDAWSQEHDPLICGELLEDDAFLGVVLVRLRACFAERR